MATLNKALELERQGFQIVFEYKLPGTDHWIDLAAFKNGQLMEGYQFVKETNLNGPSVINPREAGLAATLETLTGIPIREIISGKQRPLQ